MCVYVWVGWKEQGIRNANPSTKVTGQCSKRLLLLGAQLSKLVYLKVLPLGCEKTAGKPLFCELRLLLKLLCQKPHCQGRCFGNLLIN